MSLLERLASLGEKKLGNHQNAEARNIIKEHLRTSFDNIDIKEERFEAPVASDSWASILLDGEEIDAHLYDYTGTRGSSVEGDLYFAGKWAQKSSRKKFKNKIVVFQFNLLLHRVIQIGLAFKSGAKGVIVVSDHADYIQRSIGFPPALGECTIPAVGVTQRTYERLKNSRVQTVTIQYTTRIEALEGCNIRVDFKGIMKSEKYIVLGAHYDSWFGGAQDNCSAVQLLMDLINDLVINNQTVLHNNLRILFFDGEETGLFGSHHHAEHQDLGKYLFYFNLEMPIPTKTGKIKTMFYSRHDLVRKSIPMLKLLRMRIIPVPFSLFYRFSPIFPADIDTFNRNNVPGISTFCSNPFLHTPLDNQDNIDFGDYDALKNMYLSLIVEVDRRCSVLYQSASDTS